MPLCHCNFYSKSLNTNVNVLAFIPTKKRSECRTLSLDEIYPGNRNLKLKALYLLHGMYEDESTWVRKSNIERYAEDRKIAVIMPSAQNSYYTDLKSGLDYFTYITQELPKFAQTLFPLSDLREDNYIAGLSMGGYGAVKAAFTFPEKYAAFASLSGALDLDAIYANSLTESDKALFESVFGKPGQYKDGPCDLFYLAQKVKKLNTNLPRAYLACGIDDVLCYSMNEKFRRHLNSLEISYTYEEDKGGHDWKFWDQYIQRALDWMLEK